VVETEVTVRTARRQLRCRLLSSRGRQLPGVLVWPDAFGLRPSMRAIGRRLAGEGYAVLVPNPFYRVAKAPVYETAANVDFRDPATMQKLGR
jgi:carboxymethylenebutenolidase